MTPEQAQRLILDFLDFASEQTPSVFLTDVYKEELSPEQQRVLVNRYINAVIEDQAND
ncbi:hypothetical protein [Hymenobacter glacieicola]|uniref:hypothetical protein n=1 Tax=Hymenobacter glacieicola TaxID=1562124 RepID=UPI001669054A|nr:hypothetical protein [Hymenobacter glacieicola]